MSEGWRRWASGNFHGREGRIYGAAADSRLVAERPRTGKGCPAAYLLVLPDAGGIREARGDPKPRQAESEIHGAGMTDAERIADDAITTDVFDATRNAAYGAVEVGFSRLRVGVAYEVNKSTAAVIGIGINHHAITAALNEATIDFGNDTHG